MTEQLFKDFKNSTILVIGDAMIDCYLTGKVNRISPEAPVPIMNVLNRDYRLGGAANVALNLKSLGAHPILCSIVGNDGKGKKFYQLMEDNELDSLAIIPSSDRKTTIKYRVIGNRSQMLRIDDEDDKLLCESDNRSFITTVEQVIDHLHIDAIIFEDYDKGLFSKELIDELISFAHEQNIFISVDPKKRNFMNYKNVNLFKPNLAELTSGLNTNTDDLSMEEIFSITKQFAIDKNIDYVMTTLSERGIAIYNRKEDSFFSQPAYVRNISDVSGAGDTVISVATLCMIAKQPANIAVQIANLAGGIVCEYAGVVPIDCNRLFEEVNRFFTK